MKDPPIGADPPPKWPARSSEARIERILRALAWLGALALLPACYPALPMGGASRPRFYRSVLVDKVDYQGCHRVCEGARYAYCEVVTITSSALKSGPPRSGTVCFYGK